MRYGWASSVAVVAACYGPAVSPGAPCGPGGECPSGLECRANVCVVPGSALDAALADHDAMSDAPAGYVPWSMPVELDLTVGGETDPSMSADRRTIVFSSSNDDDLYIATRATEAGPLTAVELGPLNSAATDKSPELSADGLTIYFVSDRNSANYNVYRSTFTATWSDPMLVTELSLGNPGDIAISPDQLTAAISRNGPTTNRWVIHRRSSTAESFGLAEPHPELEITDDTTGPSITNGGDVFYFHAGGTRDLYVAYKQTNGTYTAPVPVSELNTSGRDAAPFVLQDNKHLIFERASDLYETSRP